MTIFDICQALQDSSIGTAFRESQYVFPIVESMHVLGLGVSVGGILLLDLRLTGLGMTKADPAKIMRQFGPWYLAGFSLMMLTGGLLFWGEAAKCYRSPAFRFKIVFLIIAAINAAIFEFRYKPWMEKWDLKSIPNGARIVGWLSLISWACVIGFGRWTAYGLK